MKVHGERSCGRRKSKSKSNAKKKVKCRSCSKSGHARKYYRLRKGGGENKPESSNSQKNMVDTGSTISEDRDASFIERGLEIICGFLI